MQKKWFLLLTSFGLALSLAACNPDAADNRDNAYGGNESGTAILGNDTNIGDKRNDMDRYGMFDKDRTARYDTYGNQGLGDRIDNDAQGFFNENRMNQNVRYNGQAGMRAVDDNRNVNVYELSNQRPLNNLYNGNGTLTNRGLNPWAFYDDRMEHQRGALANDYDNDGFLGYTNQNPNLFPNLRYNARSSKDAEIMADMASKIKGVDDATVFLAGGQAYVLLDVDQHIETEKQLQVHNKVRQAIEQKMPRYSVHLTSDATWFSWVKHARVNENEGRPVQDFPRMFNNDVNRADVKQK